MCYPKKLELENKSSYILIYLNISLSKNKTFKIDSKIKSWLIYYFSPLIVMFQLGP